jgi:hypothetical protein
MGALDDVLDDGKIDEVTQPARSLCLEHGIARRAGVVRLRRHVGLLTRALLPACARRRAEALRNSSAGELHGRRSTGPRACRTNPG